MPEAYVEKTQSMLGAIITAPKLTEKLLMKPPFRFLHDIVTSFLSVTAFPQGLFPEELLDSSNTTEKPKKIEFLRFLIAAVEAATGAKVAAQPSKIVAGQEADKTNELLQLLSSCAGLTPQQKAAAVQKAKGGNSAATAEPPKLAEKMNKEERAKEKERELKDEERRRRKEEEKKRRKEEEAAAERGMRDQEEMGNATRKIQEGSDKKQRGEDSHEGKREEEDSTKRRGGVKEEKTQRNEEEERRRRHEEKRRHEKKEASERGDVAVTYEGAVPSVSRGVRPEVRPVASASLNNAATTAAGKAPPRTKPAHQIVDGSQIGAAPVAGVIYESKRPNENNATAGGEDDENDWIRVAEQQEMKPGIDNSGGVVDGTGDVAQETEARGYLGQQALKAKLEQEEDALRRAQEAETRAQQGGGGIIIHSSKSGRSGAAMAEGELSKLRERLQLLTKATNPLGKLLESIYDDIDAMARELEMWRSEARTQALAAADARRQTMDSLQEVQAQLQSVEDAINDQILKTHNIRRNVINNNNAIAGMVRMIVNPDVVKR